MKKFLLIALVIGGFAFASAPHNKAVVGNEPGLIGYWKFDEAPGAVTAVDSVTTAGHVAHPGALMAETDAGLPTFVTPNPPAPVACP